VEQLAVQNPDIEFVKVDTTMVQSLQKKHSVRALPLFRAHQNGQEVGSQVVGFHKAQLESLVSHLSEK
jgi:hypothetical protein